MRQRLRQGCVEDDLRCNSQARSLDASNVSYSSTSKSILGFACYLMVVECLQAAAEAMSIKRAVGVRNEVSKLQYQLRSGMFVCAGAEFQVVFMPIRLTADTTFAIDGAGNGQTETRMLAILRWIP
jgi:hypothetical protein